MDLREFVKETLVQISLGVQDAITAHQATAGSKGVINPVWGPDASAIGPEHSQKVEFDVAVTVTDKMVGSGKAGLKVFSLELGADGSKSAEHSTVSRVKFTVPIVPAVQIVTGKNLNQLAPLVTSFSGSEKRVLANVRTTRYPACPQSDCEGS